MKKFIILIVIFAAGVVYAGYYFTPQSMPALLKPERRACSRLASLCSAKDGGETGDLKECAEALGQLRAQLGDEAARQPIKCMMEAGSCAEGAGCLGGAGVKAAAKGLGDFFKGMGKALAE